MSVIATLKRGKALLVANDLREMAENLWLVEYRINVDEASAILLAAAELLDELGQRRYSSPWKCEMCASEPERHWIEMPNNGPIVPCPLCNHDGIIPRS